MSGTALIRRAVVSRDAIGDAHRVAVPLWETAVVCAILFLSTNAVFSLLFGPNGGAANATALRDPITHKAWLLIFVFVMVSMLRFSREIVSAVAWNPVIAAVCYLALASTLWSAVPGVTLKYSLELAFSTLLGLYVGVRFGIARLVAMLSWTTAAILFLSAVFALALPRYGLDHLRGNAWRGVFTTKNELGRVMVTGLVVWIVRTLAGETKRIRGALMVVAFAAVGVESGSRTALGVSGLMLGVVMLLWLLSHDDRKFVPIKGLVVSALGLVAILFATNVKLLLAVVGSDYSLTGRAGIWGAVWKAIDVHPWLGYGFDAFWRGAQGPSLAVWRAARTPTPHSHNGYLDLLLALGAVGLAVFMLALVLVWRRALMQLRNGEGSARTFPFVYLSLFLLYNLTESSLVSGRSLEWILFVAVAAGLARDGSDRRPRLTRKSTHERFLAPAAAEQR